MRETIPHLLVVLLLGACSGDKTPSKEPPKTEPRAAAGRTAEAAAPAFDATVESSVRLAEVPGEPVIKALPGNELVCVRYKATGSGVTFDPPKLRGASGKEYRHDQHASKNYSDPAWPKQGLMVDVSSSHPFGMCYQVKADDAAAELVLLAAPSKGDVKSVAFTVAAP